MSGDDDIERLLRDVEASMASGSPTPGNAPANPPATRGTTDSTAERGRVASGVRTGLVAGAVCGAGVGAVNFLFAWLPLLGNPVSSGMGAFTGAFLTGAVLTMTRRRGS
jgi:hypothetical protein